MKLQLFVLVFCIFKIAAETTATEESTTSTTSADTTSMSTDNETLTEMNTASPAAIDNSTAETTATEESTTSMSTDNETLTEMNTTSPESTDITSNTTEIANSSPTVETRTVTDSTATSDGNAAIPSATTTRPISDPAGNSDNTTTTVGVPSGTEGSSTMSSTNEEESTSSSASIASSNTTEPTPIPTTTATTGSMASSNTTQDTTPIPTTPTPTTTAMAVTDPCLNTTVLQQCKELKFTSCVNDGQGRHHCEGCLGGWTLNNGKCRKLPRVIGKVTIQFIDGVEASFTVDLTNRNSERFIALATACCESFKRASPIVLECNVTSFTQGSIIVNFELGYPENATDINQTALAQSILDDANATGIGLDPDVQLSVVTVFCEFTSCENDGVCYINESMVQCNCIGGYTGSTCSISPTTTVIPTTLSTGAIVGIAVGCFVAVLIIIIIIVLICKFTGKNKVGSRQDMGGQQHHDDEVPLQKR